MTAPTTCKPACRTQLQLPYGRQDRQEGRRPQGRQARYRQVLCRQVLGRQGRLGSPISVARLDRPAGRRVAPVPRPDAARARMRAAFGTGFRRLRIRRILEVTGSCIMLTGFLVLALFG